MIAATLIFRPRPMASEIALLGRIIAGEIIPCGRNKTWVIRLAGTPFKSGPASSFESARRKIEHEVREWLRAAGLDDVASSLVVRVLSEQEETRARA